MQTQAAKQQLTADPGFLLSRVGAAVRAGFKEVLAGWRVRPLQYLILLVLDARGGASQQELCAAAGIDSGNMVDLLDGLEELGYARRARDPRDRRRYVVTTTQRGQSALGELRQAIEQYNADFLSPLTEPERQRLASILGKLYATTAEGRSDPTRWEPEPPGPAAPTARGRPTPKSRQRA
jgi:MarR family transcriptional regulator, lower aerobic nicotinate degradation pathway regulator